MQVHETLVLVLLPISVFGICQENGRCSVECYPVLAERNLCEFYSQLSSWRATVEGCGFSVPAPPMRNNSLPVEQQWAEARAYWERVMGVWQDIAQQEGILQDFAGSSGSGEGLTGSETDSDVQTQANWQQQIRRWEEQYTEWNQHIRDQSSTSFPDSASQEILEGIVVDESAANIRSNSRSWSALVGDWSSLHAAYSTQFSGTCSD